MMLTANASSREAPTTWKIGDGFARVHPHHAGIKALWETKWKVPCSKSLYPFHDGAPEDFEPIFETLIANDINDPMDETYTNAFIPAAQALAIRARVAPTINTRTDLYLRACALLRIARFPYIYHGQPGGMNTAQALAWSLQKSYYLDCASKWEKPVTEIFLPFESRVKGEQATIPLFVREGAEENAPVVILMTGLDGYRPDNTVRLDEFLKRGWSSITVEIPGTADCPADPADVTAPDRMWTDLLAYIAESRAHDADNVLVWGLSCGGYYAARAAHTHSRYLRAAVAQGAGIHHFFGREWLKHAGDHEYPFDLFPALAWKHGCKDEAEYVKVAQTKFSLLESGLLERGTGTCRLLMVNGADDGLMPIEDSLLCMERGNAKNGRFFENRLHMGYPEANAVVYEFLEEVMRRRLLQGLT